MTSAERPIGGYRRSASQTGVSIASGATRSCRITGGCANHAIVSTARRLVRRSGAVLAATAELRYYNRSEWGPLAVGAGLRLAHVNETPQDLIVLLEKLV